MNQLYYQPSGYNQQLPNGCNTFAEYLQKIFEMRSAVATWLGEKDSTRFSVITSPQEFRPKTAPEKGILLVHGLLDNPFQFRHLTESLQKKGFLVRTLL